MKETPMLVWQSIVDYYFKSVVYKYPYIKFNNEEEKKDNFIEFFKNKYDEIKDSYMKDTVRTLDRHKKAAIVIADILQNKVFSVENEVIIETDEKNNTIEKHFIGSEKLALLIGLSFLMKELNQCLISVGEKTIEHFHFPTAMSCETPYFDILARDLHFQSHSNDSIYILFLSHILFQIEYLTLIINDIDPSKLNEY